MNRVFAWPVIGLASCILLSSCARPLTGGPLNWDHRTRQGSVVDVMGADAAAPALADCAASGGDAQPQRYAMVRYRGKRVHHSTVAALPDDIEVHAGDKVELSPGDCAVGRPPRIERVLTSTAAR